MFVQQRSQRKDRQPGLWDSSASGHVERGEDYDAAAVREEGLACRAWLAAALAETGDWDRTVALTHFAPSLRSADPRYGG